MKTRPLVLLIIGFYIFSPALFTWMTNPSGAWYRPYVIWVAVIVVAYVLQSKRKTNGV